MHHAALDLSDKEKKIILTWHSLATQESMHYGDGAATFPDEAVIQDKFKQPGPYQLNEMQLRTILSWATSLFKSRSGGGDIRIGEDEAVFNRIKEALLEVNPDAYKALFPSQAGEGNTPRPAEAPPKPGWYRYAVSLACLIAILILFWQRMDKKPAPDPLEKAVFKYQAGFAMGEVQVKRSGAAVWENLQVGETVSPGDTIRTSADARTELTAPGMQKIQIGDNSVIVIQSPVPVKN